MIFPVARDVSLTLNGTSDGCEKSHVVKGMKSLKKCKEERLVFQPSICPGFKEGKFLTS